MIDVIIDDVECKVNVLHYVVVPPWKGSMYDCPSDNDWYGYTEVDYEIYDQNGERIFVDHKHAADIEEQIHREYEAINDY
jgi:hypothetical protein